MAYSEEELLYIDFGSELLEASLNTYIGDFLCSETDEFVKSLLAEWKAEGSPKPVKKWAEGRLPQYFEYVDKPPVWVYESGWPFLNDRPMVFITQYEMPDNSVSEKHFTGDEVLYVFGAKVGTPSNWTMEFVTVHQLKSLKDLVLPIDSLDDIDRINDLAEEQVDE